MTTPEPAHSLLRVLSRRAGFAFLLCKGASRGVLRHAEETVRRALQGHERRVLRLSTTRDAARGAVVLENLSDLHLSDRLRRLSRLNQARDALAQRGHVLLLLLLEDDLPRFAEAAPDLWSVRTKVLTHHTLPVEPRPKPEALPLDENQALPPELLELCDSFSLQGLELRDHRDRSLPRLALSSLYQAMRAAGPPSPGYTRDLPVGEVAALLSRYRLSLLTGQAGSGKTVALKHLARRLSASGRQVVMFSLAAFDPRWVDLVEPLRTLHRLADRCAWGPDLSQKPWLLLDGLDELPRGPGRRALLLWADDLIHLGQVEAAVVSGRPESFKGLAADLSEDVCRADPGERLPEVRLLPFSARQMVQYIEAWTSLTVAPGDQAAQAHVLKAMLRIDTLSNLETTSWRLSSHRLFSLCQRPLFLASLAALVRRTGEPPEGEYAVLDTFVDSLIHRRKPAGIRLSASDIRTLAGEVAWLLHQRGRVAAPVDQLISSSELLDHNTVRALRLSTGLFTTTPGQLRFVHTALYEVLVAEQAVDRLDLRVREVLGEFVWVVRGGPRLPRVVGLTRTGSLTIEHLARVAPRVVAAFLEGELGDRPRFVGRWWPKDHVAELMSTLWGAHPPLLLHNAHRVLVEQLWRSNRTPGQAHHRTTACRLAQLGDLRLGEVIFQPIARGWALARWPLPRRLYAEFMESGGYTSPEWWDARGRAWKRIPSKSRRKDQPDRWTHPSFCQPWQPVVGLSIHEAKAFVRWYQKTYEPRATLPPRWLWRAALPWSTVHSATSSPGSLGGAGSWVTPKSVEDLGLLVREWLAPEGEVSEHWSGSAYCDPHASDHYEDWSGKGGRRWYHPFGLRLARRPRPS